MSMRPDARRALTDVAGGGHALARRAGYGHAPAGGATPLLPRLLLIVLIGAAYAMAFAPGPLPAGLLAPMQVVGMACLAGAVWRTSTVRRAAWLGWGFGLGAFAVGLHWVYISLHVYGYMAAWLSGAAVALFAAGLALFPALAAGLARHLAGPRAGAWRFLPVWAAAWAGTEWLRGTIFTGFSWLNAGYAHVDGMLAGWAPLLGVYGVAFMAAFAAAALAGIVLWRRGGLRAALVGGGVVMLAGWGLQQTDWGIQPYGAPLPLRLVQGNVDQSNKFEPALIRKALDRHLALAGQAPADPDFKPGLVVLPETAIPLFQDQLPVELWQPWVAAAGRWGATLVSGVALHTPGVDGASVFTNSVIGLTGETTPQDLINARVPYRYDKAHLVPFGEFVPWGFRWFVDAMVMPMGDFDRGAAWQQPFTVADQRIAFNICYEDVFGEELLPAVRSGPEDEPGATILANVSNLGWFGDSWALPQHLQMARMRSLETGRPSIRSTNTGATAAIDARGRVQAALPYHVAGVLDTEVQGTVGLTPYVRWGNAAALLLMALALAAGLLRRERAVMPAAGPASPAAASGEKTA